MTNSDEPRHPKVKPASGPRYGRRPAGALGRASRSDDPVYRHGDPAVASASKNRVHSVLTALPVMMLVAGLVVFYAGERRQSAAAPIAAESVRLDGIYDGLSAVSSGGAGQHYLWLHADEPGAERRGVRVPPAAVASLRRALSVGQPIVIDAAPSVTGSATRWLWRVQRDGRTVFDDAERLR